MLRPSFRHLAAAAALASAATASAVETVTLARDGEALADIVVSKSAVKAARFGAEELRWHLKRMTGADFKVKTDDKPPSRLEIRVGRTSRTKTAADEFGNQQFMVKIDGEGVELIGRDRADRGEFRYCQCELHGVEGENWPGLYDEQGSLYAVYEFLETDCGVRWCDDSEFGTVIPERRALTLRCGEKRREPFVRSRNGGFGGALGFSLWRGGTENRRKWEAKGWRNPKSHALMSRLYLTRHRAGGSYRGANHSLYHFIDLYWNTNKPDNVAYRPDWFAAGREHSVPSQLCYSNPEVIAAVVKMVRDYFNDRDVKNSKRYFNYCGSRVKRWGEDQFCLEPMDNSVFCECDRCRPQFENGRGRECSQHSTYWFRFVNTVAKEIAESHPGKFIATLAYMTHEGLPTGIELEKNVRVYNCIFDNRIPASPNYLPALERMKAWHRRYPDLEFGMWLYNTFPLERANRANYKCFPGFYAHEGEKQYRIYKECNARWSTYQCGLNGASETYMQLEWMIDPDKTADELIDGYFAMFGAAAPAMKKFYALVEKRHCDPSSRPRDIVPDSQRAAWEFMGDAPTMKALAGFIGEADRLADTAQAKGALELFKLDVWEYMLAGAAEYAETARCPEPAFTARRVKPAGGDPDRADWAAAETAEPPYNFAGSAKASAFPFRLKLAHDGEYLYVEATLGVDVKKLRSAAEIYWCDDFELMIARERRRPYRCWFSAPDGRMTSGSFGEIDNGWMVGPGKSGAPPNFGVRFASALLPEGWRGRWAMPFKWLAVEPVRAGDLIRFNLASTLSPAFAPGVWPIQVFTLTPYTYVHAVDRMASLKLENGE